MPELGLRNQFAGANRLVKFTTVQMTEAFGLRGDQPVRLPKLPAGHQVVFCWLHRYSEHLVLCETVEDMRGGLEMAGQDMVDGIRWYVLKPSAQPVS